MAQLPDQTGSTKENIEKQAESAGETVKNQAESAGKTVKNQVDSAEDAVTDAVENVKETATQPVPTPSTDSGKQVEPKELLERLNWGEPALTIIDTRDRTEFNNERITGAVLMSDNVKNQLESNRDIYLYGESAGETASQLRSSGFQSISVVKGGLSAWKKAGGPVEGAEAFSSPAGATTGLKK